MSEVFDPQAKSLPLPVHVVGPRLSYTLRCALDTASEITVLPARFLRLLGCDFSRPAGRTRLRTATGIATAPLIRIPAIHALDRVRTDLLVAANDMPLGVEADGLLGLDFFRELILTLDFARGNISLDPPRKWWRFWR
jgi:Aspartyl protease